MRVGIPLLASPTADCTDLPCPVWEGLAMPLPGRRACMCTLDRCCGNRRPRCEPTACILLQQGHGQRSPGSGVCSEVTAAATNAIARRGDGGQAGLSTLTSNKPETATTCAGARGTGDCVPRPSCRTCCWVASSPVPGRDCDLAPNSCASGSQTMLIRAAAAMTGCLCSGGRAFGCSFARGGRDET